MPFFGEGRMRARRPLDRGTTLDDVYKAANRASVFSAGLHTMMNNLTHEVAQLRAQVAGLAAREAPVPVADCPHTPPCLNARTCAGAVNA
jgi:hypothetical protein